MVNTITTHELMKNGITKVEKDDSTFLGCSGGAKIVYVSSA
jgi:hypothetical protein